MSDRGSLPEVVGRVVLVSDKAIAEKKAIKNRKLLVEAGRNRQRSLLGMGVPNPLGYSKTLNLTLVGWF
jgi:hypothetical protein